MAFSVYSLKQIQSRLPDEVSYSALAINKGGVGQMVEKLIGLQLSNTHVDFTDGELKCSGMYINKSGKIKPRETLAITNIGTRVDSLLNKTDFEKSFIFLKIKNLLIVPVVQPDKKNIEAWRLEKPIHINSEKNVDLYKYLKEDYEFIVDALIYKIKTGENISTINGSNDYLQIRSKDSKPYNPIQSSLYNRYISDKNYAFYFKKKFIEDVMSEKLD